MTLNKMTVYLRATIGVERDLPILRHFMDYYMSMGVRAYRLILHACDEKSVNLDAAIRILEECGVEPAAIWITASWNTGDNAIQHRKVVEGLPEDVWVITADSDEFHEFPVPLNEFLEALEMDQIDVVKGRLTERVRSDFRLLPLRPEEDIFLQCPIETEFGIGNPGKIMLHKRSIITTPGHHSYLTPVDQEIREFPHILKVMHFKWFEGVSRKYVDPSIMAHHSNAWEFAAYDGYIRRNFFGLGRIFNIAIHQPCVPLAARCFVQRTLRRLTRQNASA